MYKAIQVLAVLLWLFSSFYIYSYNSSKKVTKLNAVKLEPLSVSNWVELADEFHQSHNYVNRNEALKVANKLAEQRPAFIKPIWYRHIIWSEFDQARTSGSRLINLDAENTYDVFMVMKNIYGVKDFLAEIIPQNLVNHKHNNLTHISVLISQLLKNEKNIELLELWDSLNNQTKTDIAQSHYMRNHYQSLSRKSNYGIIDSLSTTPKSNRQFNGASLTVPFKRNDFQNPFCWIQSILNNTQVNNINNLFNLYFLPVKSSSSTFICYIPVIIEQSTSIKISSHWSAKDLGDSQVTSLAVRVINKNNKSKHFRVVKKGNWQPEEFSYDAILDKNTLGIEIILLTPDTRKNITSGQISLTNFNITPFSKN